MNKQAIQNFYAKTAQTLRDQHETIQRQEATIQKQSDKIAGFEKQERARSLAKTAASRGIIGNEIEVFEDFVSRTMKSDRPLEVIEEGMKFAQAGDFNFAASETDAVHGSGRGTDALTSLLLGKADL